MTKFGLVREEKILERGGAGLGGAAVYYEPGHLRPFVTVDD